MVNRKLYLFAFVATKKRTEHSVHVPYSESNRNKVFNRLIYIRFWNTFSSYFVVNVYESRVSYILLQLSTV